MNSDQQANALFCLLALILPLSALVSRRVPLKKTALMAGAWFAIFAVALVAVGASRALRGTGWNAVASLFGDNEQQVTGHKVRLAMAPDGHFWAMVTLNGITRRMLIDSGATTTSVNLATAQAAGLDLEQNPIPVQIDTANGTVLAHTSTVARLSLGPIVASDLRVVVAPEFGETEVLGMNFLSRLRSWRVENRTLILEPANP